MLWAGERIETVVEATGLSRGEIKAAQLRMARDEWLAGQSNHDICKRASITPSEVRAALQMYSLSKADQPPEPTTGQPSSRQARHDLKGRESYRLMVQRAREGKGWPWITAAFGLSQRLCREVVEEADDAYCRVLSVGHEDSIDGMIADLMDGHGIEAVAESYGCVQSVVADAWLSVHGVRAPRRFTKPSSREIRGLATTKREKEMA
jgi:hypothetical protein